MSLVTDIESAWSTAIWNHETILAVTPNALPFEFTSESEYEVGKLYYRQKINFFEYVVTAREAFPLIGGGLSSRVNNVQVEIRYTLEKDTTGVTYQTVKNIPNTILSLVCSELGEGWNETVDFFNVGLEPISVLSEQVLEVPVWRVVFSFTAQSFTSS